MPATQRILFFVPLMLAAVASSALAQISISLGNPGFESAISTGVAGTAGIWQGDLNSVVTAQNGITPFADNQMLRFDHMAPDGTTQGSGADTLQLVDMSAYSSSIAAGGFTVTLSAYFNRSDSTYNHFTTILRSYSGPLGNFPSDLNSWTSVQSNDLFSDSTTATWELSSVSLALPTNTTYLALWVSAVVPSDIVNFPVGYYADSVTLTAIPEPATNAALLGVAMLGFFGMRRFRHRRAARA